MINAILACDTKYGIGKNGKLPWPYNSEDMKWFKRYTLGDVIVMGRKTWESIGSTCLPNRINVVVTSNELFLPEDELPIVSAALNGIPKLLKDLEHKYPDRNIWVIGGSNIYKEAFPVCERIYLTQFKQSYQCDVFIDTDSLKPFNNLIEIKQFNDQTFRILGRSNATVS